MKYKVVIVTEGKWGIATKDDYAFWINYIQRHLMEDANERRRKSQLNEFEVLLVDTAGEAIERFNAGERGSLVFISRSEAEQAEELARKYKNIRVYVLTGLVPPNKVIYLQKTWLKPDLLEAMFSTTPLI